MDGAAASCGQLRAAAPKRWRLSAWAAIRHMMCMRQVQMKARQSQSLSEEGAGKKRRNTNMWHGPANVELQNATHAWSDHRDWTGRAGACLSGRLIRQTRSLLQERGMYIHHDRQESRLRVQKLRPPPCKSTLPARASPYPAQKLLVLLSCHAMLHHEVHVKSLDSHRRRQPPLLVLPSYRLL